MSESETIPATIAEQIYTMMLTYLAADEAFDDATIVKLHELIDQDRLTNRNAVLKAIQVQNRIEL